MFGVHLVNTCWPLGANTLAMLEEPLMGLITNILFLGAPELTEDMSAYLAVMKSLLNELNRIKTLIVIPSSPM